jgi:hypothetical protein
MSLDKKNKQDSLKCAVNTTIEILMIGIEQYFLPSIILSTA